MLSIIKTASLQKQKRLQHKKGVTRIMAKKAYKNLNCKIDKALSDKLEKFIQDTRLSKTATVEKALEEYINKYNKTGRI